MSKVVAHHTAAALISPLLKTVQKQSTGKHHAHFTDQNIQNSFLQTEIRIKYYILLRPWHVRGRDRCKILWSRHKKLCIFWAVSIHNTNQLNTFALFPDAEIRRWPQHGEPLTSDHSWYLVLGPWRSESFMDGQIDCDHCNWPELRLFVTMSDHMWYETIHDWLTMMTIFLVKVFFSKNS